MSSTAAAEVETLLGIGAAARTAGVSERALRYYQQLGLIKPSGLTPGGMRRYSADDLDRVCHIRKLQSVLGLNLEEIATVLRNEDRSSEIRAAYHDERTDPERRRELALESLGIQEQLRVLVESKRRALDDFLVDVDARMARIRELLEASE